MNRTFFLLFFLCIFSQNKAIAQGFKHLYIDQQANGKSLVAYLDQLASEHHVHFIYEPNVLEGLTIFGVGKRYKIEDFLNVFLPTHRAVKLSNSEMIIVNLQLWKKYSNLLTHYRAINPSKNASNSIEIKVYDANTLEPIIGAEVFIPHTTKGTLTDAFGKAKLNISSKIFELTIRYTGYQSQTVVVGVSKYGDQQLDSYLYTSFTELDNITITAEGQDKNVTSIVPGVARMGIETIKSLPTFMGEVDPIKGLTTLPGVTTSGELSSGFQVRGGESGQNLILQDEAMIFNPTHLFGFFSAFNPDVVQDVELYKGIGPANYGGRASSVLDIGVRNGSFKSHKVSGGVGLISSRLGIEGPIAKNKTSYLISGRMSYSDWLIHSLNNISLKNSSSSFYDVTGKVFHRFSEHDYLSLTAYLSNDKFNFANDSIFSWSTKNLSLLWEHNFRENIISELVVSSSNYASQLENKEPLTAFLYSNSIENMKLKYAVNISNTNRKYSFGVETDRSWIEPGKLTPKNTFGTIEGTDLQNHSSMEVAAFAQADIKLNDHLATSLGLRYSQFLRLGPTDIYNFDFNHLNGRYPTITDTTKYNSGDVISNYGGLEPRISFRYLINDNTSIKLSYFRANQYLHLISYTTSPTPQDYWIASGPYIKPEIGNQFTLGWFKNTQNSMFEYSIEGFYKITENAIDYIEGADITLNKSLESGLVQGQGLAYGLEFLLKKKSGKINGWIAYTYSRSLKRFDKPKGAIPTINNGDYYPSIYDQPNNLSVILNYKTGNRSTLSANFSYITGRPITIPTSKYSYDPYLAAVNYSDRNEYRMPDYHRLDISWTIKDKKLKNKKYMGEWTLAVYNLYARKNAYAIYFDKYGTAKKLSVLGNMLPSLSYNFSF